MIDNIVEAIVRELGDRSVWNGIDDDIMEEIREELKSIISDHLQGACV